MKAMYSRDGAYLQAIIDRINGDLGYPNANADTYSQVYKRNGSSFHFILLEDADVPTLLTVEEQASVLDVEDQPDEVAPAAPVAQAEIGYSVMIGDGRINRVLGNGTDKAFYYFKGLKAQALWNGYRPIGDGQGAVLFAGFFAAKPPQAAGIIADIENNTEAITVETMEDIPYVYLGF
jgi:hypothetical protein